LPNIYGLTQWGFCAMARYPTDRFDRNVAIVAEMRGWYEANREGAITRMRGTPKPTRDDFMQALITKMRQVFDEVKAEDQAAARARHGVALQPKGKPPLRFKRAK
jgi:hypothetical protein